MFLSDHDLAVKCCLRISGIVHRMALGQRVCTDAQFAKAQDVLEAMDAAYDNAQYRAVSELFNTYLNTREG